MFNPPPPDKEQKGESMTAEEVQVSSIEKLNIARQLLAEAKEMDDILHIRDIAEAARVYAKAAKLGLENQNEAAEVKIRAERKAGEMLARMPKNEGGLLRGNIMLPRDETPTYDDLGIEKMQAHRWQMVASVPDEVFEEHIAETKAEGKELTTAGVVRIAKFEAASHKAETPAMIGKYRVIYADPPWKYNDKLVDGYGPAEFHYPTMSIEELCLLPVKELAEDNAVLFLWVTSPLLEDAFRVIRAWGFEYKTSFVWDKVKHNMGHYNSVRHEFLLVCVRGSCTPDNMRLYDSVQSIERTEHSTKPEEFRNIIDDIYQRGSKIELFARRTVEGWEAWGNEPTVSGS